MNFNDHGKQCRFLIIVKPSTNLFYSDVDSTVCNEAEQMTTPQVMRITDETGSYEDVVLRTKDNPTRRLARSLAVLSGLFNLNRESGENQDKKDEFRAARKKSWNIFKPKKKCVIETPSFQHFQEPLNIERLSFPISPIDNRDLEWYDLNKEEMNKIEMRMSDILNKFNSFSPTNYDYKLESPTESLAGSPDSECELQSECESQFLCRYDQNLSISSNILRSHNLSASCQSTDNNALNVNLRGPSTSKAQIHAPNIEEDEQKISRTVNCESGVMSDVTSIASTDSATIQSNRKKYVDSTMQFHRSSSSGFGSEYDEKSPTKFAPLTNSSPLSSPTAQCTSNYSNEHLRITPIKEKTPLMTPKKGYSSLQWAKLLQIQHGKYRLSQQDVTPTQRTKIPFEYIRRAWKPTMPFKMRLSIPADDVATKHSFEI